MQSAQSPEKLGCARQSTLQAFLGFERFAWLEGSVSGDASQQHGAASTGLPWLFWLVCQWPSTNPRWPPSSAGQSPFWRMSVDAWAAATSSSASMLLATLALLAVNGYAWASCRKALALASAASALDTYVIAAGAGLWAADSILLLTCLVALGGWQARLLYTCWHLAAAGYRPFWSPLSPRWPCARWLPASPPGGATQGGHEDDGELPQDPRGGSAAPLVYHHGGRGAAISRPNWVAMPSNDLRMLDYSSRCAPRTGTRCVPRPRTQGLCVPVGRTTYRQGSAVVGSRCIG
jgi:hypothetical protein